MFSKFTESPLTMAAGMLCGIGLVILIIGLIVGKDQIWQAGMGMIGTGATFIGVFARDNATSNRAHLEQEREEQAKRAAALAQIDRKFAVVEEKAANVAEQTAKSVVEVEVPKVAEAVAKETAVAVVKEEAQKP